MRTAESGFAAAAARWHIATRSGPGRPPGVSMAGFRTRTTEHIDLSVIPYRAVTVLVDLSDGLHAIDESSRRQQRGSVVLGLAPGRLRGGGCDIEALQVRLSPVVAHAVLDGSPRPSGSTVDTNA